MSYFAIYMPQRGSYNEFYNMIFFAEPTVAKKLPKGYASYDSDDIDETSEDEAPAPRFSKSGREIRSKFYSKFTFIFFSKQLNISTFTSVCPCGLWHPASSMCHTFQFPIPAIVSQMSLIRVTASQKKIHPLIT